MEEQEILFTTRINKSTHHKLKIKAAKDGKTLKEITNTLFLEYIERS